MRALFTIVAFVLVVTGCEKPRTPCIYEIPEGFTGWVAIEFGKTNCAPLDKRDGKLVFQIDSRGRCCTSSALETGWATDSYLYVGKTRTTIPGTAPGGGGLIWGEAICSSQVGSLETTYEVFYVGTEKQYNDHLSDMPKP